MCISYGRGIAFSSEDGKLLFNLCKYCVEVVNTNNMHIIQFKQFDGEGEPIINEDAKGDVYISGTVYKFKYVRKENQFIDINTGILVMNDENTSTIYDIDLTICKNLTPIYTVRNTIRGFAMHGKGNIYFVKPVVLPGLMSFLYRLSFNARKNRFDSIKSKEMFKFSGQPKIRVDGVNNRLYILDLCILLIFDLHTLELKHKITCVVEFNNNYAITSNPRNPETNIIEGICKVRVVHLLDNYKRTLLFERYIGCMNVIFDMHHAMLYDSIYPYEAIIYDLRTVSNTKVQINWEFYCNVSAFKVLEHKIIVVVNRKMNTVLLRTISLQTILLRTHIKRILALGEHTTNSAISKFIKSDLYDSNLLDLIVSFIPQEAF